MSELDLSRINQSYPDLSRDSGSPPMKAKQQNQVRQVPPVHVNNYMDQFNSMAAPDFSNPLSMS